MKRQFGKLLCACIATLMIIITIGAFSTTTNVHAITKVDPCDYFEGDNLNSQNYIMYSSPVASYLVKSEDGYVRIQHDRFWDDIVVEYYDEDLFRTSKRNINLELPIFGAFCETESNYYIITGQKNKEESDDKEVIRITKYDKNWEKIKHASLYGANTTIPFDAGSCRVAISGDMMVVRTSHEMYTSRDGLRHQANLTILLNIAQMEILDSQYGVSNNRTGYVSHSFNQFVKIENNKIVSVDHGDGYPRAAVLMNYPVDITEGSLSTYACEKTNILEFYGKIGENFTNASIGGFEIMEDSYLVAGCSIIQDADDPNFNPNSNTRNIYVASINKETKELNFNWITDYPDIDKELSTTSTPHLVKVDDNKCMLLWEREGSVYYATVNAHGAITSEIHSFKGMLSDCVPLLDNENLIWYVWENASINFYKVNVNNMSDYTIIEKNYDHSYELLKSKGTTVTIGCTKCKNQKTDKVFTDYKIYWRDTSIIDSYEYYHSLSKMDLNESCIVWLYGIYDKDPYINQIIIEINDPSMGIIEKYDDTSALITWLKEGKAIVSIYPKHMPSAKKTYNIWIGDIPITEMKDYIWLGNKNVIYTGQELKPNAKINTLTKGKDYTITYKNNLNVGTAQIVFKGQGDYTGTITKSFKINPKGTAISKVTAGKKQFTVKWKKQSVQTTGYQLRCSTKQNMNNAKVATIAKKNATSTTIKNLKAKKKYWVQIRTYKITNGQKYYSAWSAKKTVITK